MQWDEFIVQKYICSCLLLFVQCAHLHPTIFKAISFSSPSTLALFYGILFALCLNNYCFNYLLTFNSLLYTNLCASTQTLNVHTDSIVLTHISPFVSNYHLTWYLILHHIPLYHRALWIQIIQYNQYKCIITANCADTLQYI